MEFTIEFKKVRTGVFELGVTVAPGGERVYRSICRYLVNSRRLDGVKVEVVREASRILIAMADDMERGE